MTENSSVDTSNTEAGNTEMGKQAGLKFFSKFSIRNFSTDLWRRREGSLLSVFFLLFQFSTVLFLHDCFCSNTLCWSLHPADLNFILSGRF